MNYAAACFLRRLRNHATAPVAPKSTDYFPEKL
jgi:hypothetical protein